MERDEPRPREAIMASVSVEAVPNAATIGGDDHYEVVRGQRVEVPRMGAYESWLASALMKALLAQGRAEDAGRVVAEMLFLIDPADGLQRRPDLAFVSYERWPEARRVPRAAAWGVVPDLAVEVVSPSNSAAEVVEKLGEYFRAGVRLVWVVYPLQAEVHVWASPEGSRVRRRADVLDGGDVLPGFRLPLGELFDPEDDDPA
jgi:Uma2 family endonuclease